MSYCVNCGVELDSSAKKCALCDTAVFNPNVKAEKEKPLTPFSDETHIPNELPSHVKKRITVSVVTMVMLIPNLVCILLNLTVFKSNPWSMGVLWITLFLWSAFVLPFCTKKPHPYVLWATDSVVAFINAMVQVWLLGGDRRLFTGCFLPVIAVVSLVVLAYMLWYKKKRHIILKLAFIFLGLAVSCLLCGIILSFAGILSFGTQIGIICFVSFFAVFGFFIYCYSSKTIRKWASKRFFV